MDIKKRIGDSISSLHTGKGAYKCYVPKPLPLDPPIDIERLVPRLEKASRGLGLLQGTLNSLPKHGQNDLLLSFYLRKEAILSSQIEGTESSFFDLLYYETTNKFHKYQDTRDITSYKEAMEHGIASDLPISSRLLCEIHRILMEEPNKTPGEYRRTQNWIGGTSPANARHVPPPHNEVPSLISNLEKFINNENIPAIVKAAISHVQFETIHPFLDGNGRVGRILISLILNKEIGTPASFLYLSLYLKQNHRIYYDLLQSTRVTGDWESWVEFFLDGIAEVALQGAITAQNLVRLFEKDRERISNIPGSSKIIHLVYEIFTKKVFANTRILENETGKSRPSLLRAVKKLEELGIIERVNGNKRHQVFHYKECFDLLDKEINFER